MSADKPPAGPPTGPPIDPDEPPPSDDDDPRAPPVKKRRSRAGNGASKVRIAPPDADPDPNDWRASLRYTQGGTVTKDPGNAALLLTNLPEWKGCLRYDEFSERITWERSPPPLPGIDCPRSGKSLEDHHVVFVQHWLARVHGVSFSREAAHDAIVVSARSSTVNPLRDYLSRLVWDGQSRLATWLLDYCGADDKPYTHAVGRWWAISAVARAYEPGCQADHLVVLEGPQGAGKSTVARILGGRWYLARIPDITQRDAAAMLAGHWIVEIGELDAFRGAALTRVKDWVACPIDSFRPAYGRYSVRRPRSCVFIATTNESQYLVDPTGGRRFWPVATGRIDVGKLREDRDQLWAEAVKEYLGGMPWHPQADLLKSIGEEQEDRYLSDEWEERIASWLAEESRTGKLRDRYNGVTIGDVLAGALKLEVGKWGRPEQTRAGICLRKLGLKPAQITDSVTGARVRRYFHQHGQKHDGSAQP